MIAGSSPPAVRRIVVALVAGSKRTTAAGVVDEPARNATRPSAARIAPYSVKGKSNSVRAPVARFNRASRPRPPSAKVQIASRSERKA